MKRAIGDAPAALTFQLADMCAAAARAMNQATHALLRADIELAEVVIAGQEQTAALNCGAQETAFRLLSLQSSTALC